MKISCLAVLLLLAACSGSAGPASPSAIAQAPGTLGDTWVGDGAKWHLAASAGPSARYFATLAYDAPRHEYLLFGGLTAKGPSAETWTWDGKRWTHLTPAHSPRARSSAAMAFDPRLQAVLMYGGRVLDQAEAAPDSDTWAWNGNDWSELSVRNDDPAGRDGARMVTADGDVLLFGGRDRSDTYQADVWTWDGTTWTRVDHGPTPEGRNGAATQWNPVDSSLFVYGGLGLKPETGGGNLGRPLGDAWTLHNGAWTELKALGPPAIGNGGAIWDPTSRRVLILFGMACPNPIASAWAWDGAKWSRLPDVAVPARWGAAMAQDSVGNVVVFGGSNASGC
ncbi:MAG: hypothetical protein E6J20_12960 [Chloroflexi bacterium]|nr:MAG: hypothetical protein E6J20_12960 [Chloroflexota bacterium]